MEAAGRSGEVRVVADGLSTSTSGRSRSMARTTRAARRIPTTSPRREKAARELSDGNYHIRAEDRLGEGSLKQKCRDNFAAIELVNRFDTERRAATDDEKRILVKYVGWGGIPQVFARHAESNWKSERQD